MKNGKEVAREIILVIVFLCLCGMGLGWLISGFVGALAGAVVAAFPAYIYGQARKKLFLMRLENRHYE